MTDSTIHFYGADWCGDCRRSKKVFERTGVAYVLHDVEHDEGAAQEAQRVSGQKHIPVIAFEDGTVLVEPSDPELTKKLNELGLVQA